MDEQIDDKATLLRETVVGALADGKIVRAFLDGDGRVAEVSHATGEAVYQHQAPRAATDKMKAQGPIEIVIPYEAIQYLVIETPVVEAVSAEEAIEAITGGEDGK